MSWEIVTLISVIAILGTGLLLKHWEHEAKEQHDYGPDVMLLRKHISELSADVASLKKAHSEAQLAKGIRPRG